MESILSVIPSLPMNITTSSPMTTPEKEYQPFNDSGIDYRGFGVEENGSDSFTLPASPQSSLPDLPTSSSSSPSTNEREYQPFNDSGIDYKSFMNHDSGSNTNGIATSKIDTILGGNSGLGVSVSPQKEYQVSDNGSDFTNFFNNNGNGTDSGYVGSPGPRPNDDFGFSSYSSNLGLNEISSLLECFSLANDNVRNGPNAFSGGPAPMPPPNIQTGGFIAPEPPTPMQNWNNSSRIPESGSFSFSQNDQEKQNQITNSNSLYDLQTLGLGMNLNLEEFDDAQKNQLIRILQAQLITSILSPNENRQLHLNNSPIVPNFPPPPSARPNDDNLERAARFHREAAAGLSEAKYTWSGELPQSDHKNPSYSCKVFFGGIPWDITEEALKRAFRPFGNMTVSWPKVPGSPSPKGFAYGIFENEYQVKTLLENCTRDYNRGGSYFYKVSSKKNISKEVEIIPWALCDANYVFVPNPKLDGKRTIFVGAIHGMLNAEGLGKIMNELFGGVVYAGIDTDQNKYPIGSARITFCNSKSYRKAVAAGFVEVRSPRFNKTIQLDPYLEDSVVCSNCNLQLGPYFCRTCFVYFCNSCYKARHPGEEFVTHRPMTRKTTRTQSTPSVRTIMPSLFHGHHYSKQGCFNNHSGMRGGGTSFGGNSGYNGSGMNHYGNARHQNGYMGNNNGGGCNGYGWGNQQQQAGYYN